MSHTLLAEFQDGEALMQAARAVRDEYQLVDAYSPIPIEDFDALVGETGGTVRPVMFFAGFGIAALAYAIEFYSAVIDYPIDSGGRPLHSWPAFMMFPFSVGILSAAVFGLLALLVRTGLPRMNHPLFDVPGFGRVTQDRFALEVVQPEAEAEHQALLRTFEMCGAVSVQEVAP